MDYGATYLVQMDMFLAVESYNKLYWNQRVQMDMFLASWCSCRHFIEHIECKINKNSHIMLLLTEQALKHLYIEN